MELIYLVAVVTRMPGVTCRGLLRLVSGVVSLVIGVTSVKGYHVLLFITHLYLSYSCLLIVPDLSYSCLLIVPDLSYSCLLIVPDLSYTCLFDCI